MSVNNLIEARPVLEKLHDAKPDDAAVLESLAFATMATVIIEKDTVKQNAIRLQARAMAERAKELGRNSMLIQQLIEMICADGTQNAGTAAVNLPWSQ